MKMTVDLKEHSYPIYIERGILKEAAERIAEVYQGSKIMIISDDRVYRCACGNMIDRDFQASINLKTYGEKFAG